MYSEFKLTTIFTSRKDSSTYLGIPLVPYSFKTVVETFEKLFKNEVDNGTLTFVYSPASTGFKQHQILCIKGLINWDGLPVTDVEIYFNGNSIEQITAKLFSFYGESSLKDLSKVYCPDKIQGKGIEQLFPATKENNMTELYVHYANATRCLKQKGDKVDIRLFTKNASNYKPIKSENDILPIIIRNEYQVSQNDLKFMPSLIDSYNFSPNPDNTISFPFPTFLGLDYEYAVKTMTYYPPAHPEVKNKWGKFIVELDTSDNWLTITENLSKIIPNATWQNGSTILYKDKHNIRVLHDTTKIVVTLKD